MEDALQVLGVAPEASQREIQEAYREQMKKYHPDRIEHLGEEFKIIADEKSKRLNQAYSTIIENRRKKDMSALSRLEDVEFAENPEPRCPCILLLDTSSSMAGAPINALNDGLQVFQQNTARDNLAARRVDVAVVTFDSSIKVIQNFVTVDQFQPPTLTAQGGTDMAGGIERALDMIRSRKDQYRANGVAYYRPWVFMITDGEPNSGYESAAQRIKLEEKLNRVAFFAVGVEGANMSRLKDIVVRTPVKLNGLNFAEMFVWLSASMQRVSQSKLDEQVALPPAGWGTV